MTATNTSVLGPQYSQVNGPTDAPRSITKFSHAVSTLIVSNHCQVPKT